MTELAQEAARLVDSLPADKARALLEFARFLAEKADDEAWERQVADAGRDGKLRAAVAEVEREIAEGRSAPLDPSRL